MPNRYEREIEEILRNLEHTDPQAAKSQKFGERFRRNPGPPLRTRPMRSSGSWNLSPTERLLLGAVIGGLIAGGYAYLAGPNIITLILALASFICLILVACSQLISLPPGRRRSTRYGNVTITPLRRGPFHMFKTQWNLLVLKLKYRRKDEP
jgi:hypothetical protein